MRTYTITLSGKPYSNFVTGLRSPAKILAAYREHMAALGYALSWNDLAVRVYPKNALDSYGN